MNSALMRRATTVFLVLAIVFLLSRLWTGAQTENSTGGVVAASSISPAEHSEEWRKFSLAGVYGDTAAPTQIVEFTDYQCPSCQRLHLAIDSLMSSGTRIGVRIIHFPLESHPLAFVAAQASLCATDQGSFEAMHRQLFERSHLLGTTSWREIAEAARVPNPSALLQCMSETATKAKLARSDSLGRSLSLRGTPTIFVNGWRFDGAMSSAQLRSLIADLERDGRPRSALKPLTMGVNTSTGVALIEVSKAAIASATQLVLDAAPRAILGGSQGDPEFDLTGVTNVEFLDDGRIVVFGGVGLRLMVFSADGRSATSLLRKGRGPGEVLAPIGISRWKADSIATLDVGNHKALWLSATTGRGRELVFPPEMPLSGRLVGTVGDDELVLSDGGRKPRGVDKEQKVVRGSAQVSVVAPDGRVTKLATLRDLSFVRRARKGAPDGSLDMVRLSAVSWATVWDSLIVAAPGDEYKIDMYSADGTHRATIRLARPRRAITAAMRAEAIEKEIQDGLNQRAESAVRFAAPGEWERNAFYADSLPAIYRMFAVPHHALWIVDGIAPTDTGFTAVAFRSDGSLAGVLDAKVPGVPIGIGQDKIAIMSEDEDGTTAVRVYRIRKK